MPTNLCELHHVYFPCEACQRIGSSVVKVQVTDEKLIAGLAEQGVKAGAGYRPGESFHEWLQKAERVLGKGYGSRTAREMFSLMRDVSHTTPNVNPIIGEGQDLASSHTSPKADEEGEGCLRRLAFWDSIGSPPEMPKDAPRFVRGYTAHSCWVVSGSAEAAEGAISAPLPLIASDGEDVGEQVDVALDTSLRDILEALVAPLCELYAFDMDKLALSELWELAEEGIDALCLEETALLAGTDLIPVSLKSFTERLSGYRPTLHGQNLGLLRSGPEVSCGLGLEGARLANSVPRDLEFPPVLDPSEVRHRRRA